MIDNDIRTFIEKYADLIEDENFDKLYEVNDGTSHRKVSPSALTSVLLEADINPLNYLTHVPSYAYYGVAKKQRNIVLNFADYPSVQGIDSNAFGEYGVSELVVSNNITYIEVSAFYNCYYLKKVVIQGNPKIDSDAFISCPIEDLYMPNLTSKLKFSEKLKHITLRDVGKNTIKDLFQLRALEKITFLDTQDRWKALSKGLYSRSNILIECSDGTISQEAVSIDAFKGKHEIPYETFKGRNDLTTITIPSSVTEIGSGAFEDCQSLSQIDLNKVEVINFGAFNGTSLKEIILPTTARDVSDYAFFNAPIQRLVVPEGSALNFMCIRGCSGLKSLEIMSPISVEWDSNAKFTLTIVPGVKLFVNKKDYNCLKKIIFKGTKAEWQTTADQAFKLPTKPLLVSCTDGDLEWSEKTSDQKSYYGINTTPGAAFPRVINPARTFPFWKNSDAGSLMKGRLYWDSAEEAQNFIDESGFTKAVVFKSPKSPQEFAPYTKLPGGHAYVLSRFADYWNK